LVDLALDSAPKKYTLGSRNPAFDLPMPAPMSYYNLDGCGVSVFDYNTWTKRPSTLKDTEDAARIFEQIGIGNMIWAPVSAIDVPPGTRNLSEITSCLKYCSKHLQDEVKEAKEVPYMIEILKAILGSEESVRERKILSVTYCTLAPLSHEKNMLEATMDLSHYDVPIAPYPMPGAGSTGPATLFSNLAIANAEELSAFVLFQLESPGVPMIFSGALGAVNRRNCLFLEGAAETSLLNQAMGEMGKYYGFPGMQAGCLSDAKEPGMQAVLEKIMTSWPLALSGVDVIQGIGLIESSMTLSLEQMLVDEQIALYIKRLVDGINVSDETDLFEDIKSVGPGGHFLMQDSTIDVFRSDEFFNPDLVELGSHEEWISIGSPNMFARAHEKVTEILESEEASPLPDIVIKQIDEIMNEAKLVLV
jgi:trimethylamine--corrinoid protein Co-methyltransferase